MDYSRLKISLFLLTVTFVFGTTGYVVFEDMTPFEAFYMTLITISTVGFSEIHPLSDHGRLVTVVVIISGISLLTYTLGQVASIFVEGELRRVLGRKKLEKQIANLRDHYIICGYGRIGEIIVRELTEAGMALVVLEQNAERTGELEAGKYLYLNMDATTDEALIAAGIERARGLVATVSSDSDNVYITLSAKGMRSDIFILARASDSRSESKLFRAGASRVVCPYQMGGRRMAEILYKPTVVDFLDLAMMQNELGLDIEEAMVTENSTVLGETLQSSQLRQKFGVIIIAMKRVSGEMVFNPGPSEVFQVDDVIVVLGKKQELHRMSAGLGLLSRIEKGHSVTSGKRVS